MGKSEQTPKQVKREISEFERLVTKGLKLSYKRLVAQTKANNDYLWTMRDGKVVKVYAKDL